MSFLLLSCQANQADSLKLPTDPNGNLVLYVMNMSPARRTIDVKVFVDERLAVDETVKKAKTGMGGPNERKEYRFQVEPGDHVIRVSSEEGEATARATFSMKDKLWGSVAYAYTPETEKGVPMKPEFTIRFQEKPILFQ